MINATSPNQEGVEGTDSEEVWMITEESAILVISTSLLGTILFFLIKEAYFYARSLLVTSRCAIRGKSKLVQTAFHRWKAPEKGKKGKAGLARTSFQNRVRT